MRGTVHPVQTASLTPKAKAVGPRQLTARPR
jgi:hypothetical protein